MAIDMLPELNKEYLREVCKIKFLVGTRNTHVLFLMQMGITPMGDIISILRHSKTVTDQTARDEIMAEHKPMKVIAKINPAPMVSSTGMLDSLLL